MRIIKTSLSVFIIGLLIFIPFSYGEENLTLKLEDCIVKALKDNLKIAIEVYNPEVAETRVAQSREIFMPSFELSYGNENTETASSWWLQGEEVIQTKRWDYSASLVQQIPTGGNVSISLSNFKTDTNQSFQNFNPYYRSSLRFDFTQPLLKDFGFRVNRKNIIVARNNLDISVNQLKTVIQDTIYRVQEAYWNLVYARENYQVKRQSLKLAKDLLEKNLKEVEVGRLAQIEILNAQAVVASREADLLQAEALIRGSEDQLRNIMNLPAVGEDYKKGIIPLGKPEFAEKEIVLSELIAKAYENRFDLKIMRKNIDTNKLNLSVAKNQLLPNLNFQVSYWSPGISGDRLKYLNDNPLTGVVVGKEEGSVSESLSDAFNFIYNNWTVSFNLSIPLSSFLSRAAYAEAKMEMQQALVELEHSKKEALIEVRDAVRAINTNAKRYKAYKLSRELAEKRLKAEEKKLEVGLTTNYFVLEYQEAVSEAQSNELKALVDYNLARARLEKAMGITLEQRNIKISQFYK